MHNRDYSAIALALLEARGPKPIEGDGSYVIGWVDGVDEAAARIADRIAATDPTFDREDFLKQTRGE